jgi:hypothetical protein
MKKRKSVAARRRLPKGIVRRRGKLIVDAAIEVVRVSPNLVLFVRPPKKGGIAARAISTAVGWGSCTCTKAGGCEALIVRGPDRSKFTWSCVSTGCTGDCNENAGTVPKGNALTAAMLAVLA